MCTCICVTCPECVYTCVRMFVIPPCIDRNAYAYARNRRGNSRYFRFQTRAGIRRYTVTTLVLVYVLDVKRIRKKNCSFFLPPFRSFSSSLFSSTEMSFSCDFDRLRCLVCVGRTSRFALRRAAGNRSKRMRRQDASPKEIR